MALANNIVEETAGLGEGQLQLQGFLQIDFIRTMAKLRDLIKADIDFNRKLFKLTHVVSPTGLVRPALELYSLPS